MSEAVEMSRFTVRSEDEAVLLDAWERAITMLTSRFPGLVSARLASLGGEEWTDVLVWESRELAEAAAQGASEIPEIADCFRHMFVTVHSLAEVARAVSVGP